jgi:hypothetical protein
MKCRLLPRVACHMRRGLDIAQHAYSGLSRLSRATRRLKSEKWTDSETLRFCALATSFWIVLVIVVFTVCIRTPDWNFELPAEYLQLFRMWQIPRGERSLTSKYQVISTPTHVDETPIYISRDSII